MPSRSARLALMLAAFLSLALLALALLAIFVFASPGVAMPASPAWGAPLPAAAPPPAQSAGPISPFVSVSLSAVSLDAGEPLTVTAQLDGPAACTFWIGGVTLDQSNPLFAYSKPASNHIEPPWAVNPATWRLSALGNGETILIATFTGQYDCGGGVAPLSLQGESPPVRVAGTFLHLPAGYKAPPPTLPPVVARDLGTLGGPNSAAYDVNSHGQVVGISAVRPEDQWGQGRAFLWHNGRMKDLGTLGGENSTALAINDGGQIAGDSELKVGLERHAFLWVGGRMTDIGTLGGGWSHTVALNARGQVAGNSGTPAGATHCFVWTDGVLADLGTLGGADCFVSALNDRGQIVGYSTLPGAAYLAHAFLWQDGAMIDLTPALGSGASSSAVAINERGQIAGSMSGTGTPCNAWGCAVLWDNGAVIDLSAGGAGLNMVEALNERGQVLGIGNYQSFWFPYGYTWDVQLWDNGVLTNLGFKRGRMPIFKMLLDNGGQVIVSDGSSVKLWQGGVLTPLAPPEGLYAYAAAMNDAGYVAGNAEHALLWQIAPAMERAAHN